MHTDGQRLDVSFTGYTAFPHRAPGYNLIVISEWMDPKDNNACTAWARDSYTAMKPFKDPGDGEYAEPSKVLYSST